jgi:hypothetical protein
MLTKTTTWPPGAPQRARSSSGSTGPAISDRLEAARSQSGSAAAAPGETRPAESHWESLIDRATD